MANRVRTNSKKTELSLSAIMFFSPLIQNIVKRNNKITIEDRIFVRWFIHLWYFNILLLLATITLQILFYMNKIDILQTISLIIMAILAISLIIWSIYIISGKSITTSDKIQNNINSHNTDNQKINNEDIFEQKLEIFSYYIPIYNIYIRYKKHNFDNPNIFLKESILIWSIYAILFVSVQNQAINRVLISILSIKIIATLNNLHLPKVIENKIKSLFYKNPEEIRWYISWIIKNIFNKTVLSENIKIEKEKYSLLLKPQKKEIIIEYSILYIISIYGLYIWYISNNSLLIFSILFIISRYIIMHARRNHLPHIPIIKDITGLFFKSKIL